MYLESRGLAANTINQQLAAVRRLAHEAADSGLLSPELAAGISRVKGVKQLGFRSGNWLSAKQSSEVLKHACGNSMRAKRDYAMLALLSGCGFRRSELPSAPDASGSPPTPTRPWSMAYSYTRREAGQPRLLSTANLQ